MNVVADTGVLLAAVDADDRRHQDCSEVLASRAHSLVVPAPVVTETSWMIESVLGPAAEASFVTAVGLGELAVIDLDRGDYTRCAELIDRYADLGLGLVDASVVAVAERLGITTLATINHRDFRVVRPQHVAAFELIP